MDKYNSPPTLPNLDLLDPGPYWADVAELSNHYKKKGIKELPQFILDAAEDHFYFLDLKAKAIENCRAVSDEEPRRLYDFCRAYENEFLDAHPTLKQYVQEWWNDKIAELEAEEKHFAKEMKIARVCGAVPFYGPLAYNVREVIKRINSSIENTPTDNSNFILRNTAAMIYRPVDEGSKKIKRRKTTYRSIDEGLKKGKRKMTYRGIGEPKRKRFGRKEAGEKREWSAAKYILIGGTAAVLSEVVPRMFGLPGLGDFVVDGAKGLIEVLGFGAQPQPAPKLQPKIECESGIEVGMNKTLGYDCVDNTLVQKIQVCGKGGVWQDPINATVQPCRAQRCIPTQNGDATCKDWYELIIGSNSLIRYNGTDVGRDILNQTRLHDISVFALDTATNNTATISSVDIGNNTIATIVNGKVMLHKMSKMDLDVILNQAQQFSVTKPEDITTLTKDLDPTFTSKLNEGVLIAKGTKCTIFTSPEYAINYKSDPTYPITIMKIGKPPYVESEAFKQTASTLNLGDLTNIQLLKNKQPYGIEEFISAGNYLKGGSSTIADGSLILNNGAAIKDVIVPTHAKGMINWFAGADVGDLTKNKIMLFNESNVYPYLFGEKVKNIPFVFAVLDDKTVAAAVAGPNIASDPNGNQVAVACGDNLNDVLLAAKRAVMSSGGGGGAGAAGTGGAGGAGGSGGGFGAGGTGGR